MFGRGLAELKKGMADQGKADIAQAEAANPHIAEEAGKYGLKP